MPTKLHSLQTATQVHDSLSTTRIHWYLVASLLPLVAWGLVVFGWYSALVVLTAVGTAVVADLILHRLRQQPLTAEGSSTLWGLLIALTLPPSVPLYVPAVAALFAIWVVKGMFGGLGAYWLNPVLAARAFVLAAWAGPMTTWQLPSSLTGKADLITGATPLTLVKDSLKASFGSGNSPMEILASHGFGRSNFDQQATDWLNNHLFNYLNLSLPGGYLDLVVGHSSGAIGEVSGLLILAATVFLLARGILDWRVPGAAALTYGLLVWILGGLPFGGPLFSGDVIFALFSGGFLLGIFFLATEHSTTPLTRQSLYVYGLGVGGLAFGLRIFGSQPEGIGAAILAMNLVVPLLDGWLKDRPFGAKKSAI